LLFLFYGAKLKFLIFSVIEGFFFFSPLGSIAQLMSKENDLKDGFIQDTYKLGDVI